RLPGKYLRVDAVAFVVVIPVQVNSVSKRGLVYEMQSDVVALGEPEGRPGHGAVVRPRLHPLAGRYLYLGLLGHERDFLLFSTIIIITACRCCYHSRRLAFWRKEEERAGRCA